MHVPASRLLTLGLAGGAAFGALGVAYAVGASSTPAVIQACFKNAAPHALTYSPQGTCPANASPLSWNQQGVPGTPGAPGSPGMSNFVTESGTTGTVPAGNISAIDVPCPSGEIAISGGFDISYPASVLQSQVKTGNPGIWSVKAAFPSTSGTITAYVQCATVAAAGAAPRSAVASAPRITITPLPQAGGHAPVSAR
jgi:hypothetical protein